MSKIVFAILFLLLFTGFSTESRADWTVSLNVTLNGSGQLPLVFGKKTGATDNFDAGVDQLAAPQTPDGDSYYFRSITGEAVPKNNLLEDCRANNFSQATWRLALTAADTKTFVVSWEAASLPVGWGFTWQEANNSWVGSGPVHNFTDSPKEVRFTNDTGDLSTKRYLLTATAFNIIYSYLPLIIK